MKAIVMSAIRPIQIIPFLLFLALICGCKTENPVHEKPLKNTGSLTESDPVIQGISKLIAKNNTSDELYFKRGDLLYQRERYKEAETDLKKAIELKEDPKYYHFLADIQLDGARTKNAIETLQKVVEKFPSRIPSYLKLSEFYFILKQYDKSISTINEVVRLDPQNADAYFMLGMNFRDMKDTDKALNALQRSVEIDADMVDAWILLGDIHEQKGESEAVKYYSNAVAAGPENIEALHTLAYFYQNHDKVNEALLIYEKILNLNPKYTDAHLNSGILRLSMDSLDQALGHFNMLINMDPAASRAYYFRGLTKELLGEPDKAKADYQNSINIVKENNPANEALSDLIKSEQ